MSGSTSQVVPFRMKPMLPTLVREPFHRDGWIYEEKYDGYRIAAYKEGGRVTLISRNGIDRTERYPGVAMAIAKLRQRTLALDGEVVIFDQHRVSRFQLLQNVQSEPRYAVFDCLYLNGRDLRALSWTDRRAALDRVIAGGRLFRSRLFEHDGLIAYRDAQRKGLEGVVAKDAASPYVEGRSRYWLKFKVHLEDEFVIAGYTAPAGTREHFGALLLGAYDHGTLRYAGKVGTGFTHASLAALARKFRAFEREKTALADPPRERGVTWLAPKLVAQIAYQEWTGDRKLRQPVFLGLRDDKSPGEVNFPEI